MTATPIHHETDAVPPSSARVVRHSDASMATRLAAPLLFSTLRVGLELLLLAGTTLPVSPKHVFWAGRIVDLPTVLLAPEPGTHREMVRFARFRAEWLWHDATADARRDRHRALLYLHGGAFITGGLHSHRRMAARIGRECRLPVFNVDYRMLPYGHLTDALEDALTAYRHLLCHGFPAEGIMVAGDSAGGGLAFLLALALRDAGLPMPAGIAAIAPWADLDNTARLNHPNVWSDPIVPAAGLGAIADWGFAVDGALDPRWSPANHDFTGLPPVLIHVGSTEVLHADAEQLAHRCHAAGVDCVLEVWDRAPHVFHLAADLLPDARRAIAHIGHFSTRLVPPTGYARLPRAA